MERCSAWVSSGLTRKYQTWLKRSYTQVVFDLTCKYQTKLKSLAWDTHYCLLVCSISNKEKSYKTQTILEKLLITDDK